MYPARRSLGLPVKHLGHLFVVLVDALGQNEQTLRDANPTFDRRLGRDRNKPSCGTAMPGNDNFPLAPGLHVVDKS